MYFAVIAFLYACAPRKTTSLLEDCSKPWFRTQLNTPKLFENACSGGEPRVNHLSWSFVLRALTRSGKSINKAALTVIIKPKTSSNIKPPIGNRLNSYRECVFNNVESSKFESKRSTLEILKSDLRNYIIHN